MVRNEAIIEALSAIIQIAEHNDKIYIVTEVSKETIDAIACAGFDIMAARRNEFEADGGEDLI
ncbi:hypothetical protein H2509_18480 [Stappia sp. F7233]|uniref:Uncharacterized protein n=1 Tax=Stappia albiluteola TaxID=2758565 RepID=A0A839AKZ2_9HYPH|nr:hypothetical protein [Stappia albiluteola]MBA5779119.1 hypothetical protein [Stappia albiluteola]